MQSKIFIFVILIALSLPAFASIQNNNEQPIPDEVYALYKPSHVIDGDTFIANDDRIRLWGINAPEKNHPLYDVATVALKHFLKDQVRCKHIDIDKYQRSVMRCLTLEGVDVGGMMVFTGMAKDFKKYSGGFYSSESAFAKEHKLGLWKE